MSVLIEADGIGDLLAALTRRGYRCIGPTARDGAIVMDEIEHADDLPWGYTEAQDAGTYRLERRDDDAGFGFAVGPHSARRFLSPPRSVLWSASRTDGGFAITDAPHEPDRYAFIGLRACDLAAIAVQDRVFRDGAAPDPSYTAERDAAFIVAVNCGVPGGTCFCASMGTGPGVEGGHDLALTELVDGSRHDLLVDVGSDRGADVLADIDSRPATDEDREAAADVTRRATEHMGRSLDEPAARVALAERLEHPRWDDVAARCLSCTNCTLVCPTCFCSTVEDITDLTGDTASHVRRWDSCFTLEHSALHGGSIRSDTRSQYRQWLTHKLSTWWDQFEVSGCVGCGRCITWCPVGIDLTEEAAAIAASMEGAPS